MFLRRAEALDAGGVSTRVVNVPVIKPLDGDTVLDVVRRSKLVVTAENHSIIGGLGSAVAEVMAEAGVGCPLRRIGLRDTFAEGARTAPPLFRKYGLGTQDIIDAAWSALSRTGAAPAAPVVDAAPGEYAPV